jgi:hypothetical protein
VQRGRIFYFIEIFKFPQNGGKTPSVKKGKRVWKTARGKQFYLKAIDPLEMDEPHDIFGGNFPQFIKLLLVGQQANNPLKKPQKNKF